MAKKNIKFEIIEIALDTHGVFCLPQPVDVAVLGHGGRVVLTLSDPDVGWEHQDGVSMPEISVEVVTFLSVVV